jgi:N-acetylglutamate synthase-like GNAT family acetyltransferase
MDDRTGLRPACGQDLEASESLLRAANLPVSGLSDQFGPSFVVREVEGRIIALAGVERYGDFGLLRSVAVIAGDRKTGVGRELVQNRIRWAEEDGLQALFLLTETAPDFFEHLGFRPIDRARAPREILASLEWSRACPQTAVAMSLVLKRE